MKTKLSRHDVLVDYNNAAEIADQLKQRGNLDVAVPMRRELVLQMVERIRDLADALLTLMPVDEGWWEE